MAKSVIKRNAKYQRKLDEDHVAKQLKLAHQDMVDAYALAQADLASTEEVARELLGEHNIPTVLYPSYLNFTRQVWKAKRGFSGNTLKTETQILVDKWKARQLDGEVLDDIRFRVFAIDKPAE